jgi:hypothetical protein
MNHQARDETLRPAGRKDIARFLRNFFPLGLSMLGGGFLRASDALHDPASSVPGAHGMLLRSKRGAFWIEALTATTGLLCGRLARVCDFDLHRDRLAEPEID